MPRFRYRGVDDTGRDSEGVLESRSLVAASRELRDRKIAATTLEREDPETGPRPLVEMDAFSYFNRSLAALTRVGIPLPQAVREISRGLRRGRFKKGLEGVESSLKEGKSLEEAVREAPGAFPPHYRSIVAAGIACGDLSWVLLASIRIHESYRGAKRAVAGALAYPALVLSVGLVAACLLYLLFLPGYEQFYRVHGLVPSPPVRLAFWTLHSRAIVVSLVFGVPIVVGVSVVWALRTTKGEGLLYRLPLLGRVLRTVVTAQFLATLSVLLQGKVQLQDALPIAAGASGSRQLAGEAEGMGGRAAEGETLAEILEDSNVPSPGIQGYLRLAEEGGGLAEGSGEMAEILTEQSRSETDTLFFVIFPLAILAVGLLIGSVVTVSAMSYLDLLKQLPR